MKAKTDLHLKKQTPNKILSPVLAKQKNHTLRDFFFLESNFYSVIYSQYNRSDSLNYVKINVSHLNCYIVSRVRKRVK